MNRTTATIISATALAVLAALSVADASAAEARATGNLPIRSGPASWYPVIGTLPDGERVGLSRCTRASKWCRIVYDGGPDGWVMGSYLVGSPAKAAVTPPDFVDPPGFPF